MKPAPSCQAPERKERETVVTLLDYRPSELAHPDARSLLANLGATEAHIDRLVGARAEDKGDFPEARRLLFRWATDVPLNIAWYEQRPRWNRWDQGFGIALVLTLGLALLTVTAFKGFDAALAKASSGAGIALAVTFVLTLLQLVANLTDRKARIGAFWKASSDLQERLYTFQDRYRGKPILERVDGHTDRVSIPFTVALTEEIAKARTIAREERTSCFASLISPGDLLSIVTQGIAAVRTKRDAYEEARRQEHMLVQVRGQQAAAEQVQLDTTHAKIEAKGAELAQLGPGDRSRRAQLAVEIESLRLDAADAERRLQVLLSA
jgi:hypothetical protein